MSLVPCRECAQQISTEAASCPRCGAPGYAAARAQQQMMYIERRRPSNGLAAVLSFLVPGLGQLYKGRFGMAFVWFIGAVIGYSLLIVPGLIVHVTCIINAATADA